MNKNRIALLIGLFMCLSAQLIISKSAVYIQTYDERFPIKIGKIHKTDKNTEQNSSTGTILQPFKPGTRNRVLLFKLSRGAGDSNDFTDASIQVGIPKDPSSDEYDWVDLFSLSQKVEHRFLHSNMYAKLKTKQFDSDFKEVNANEPIITTTKVAGKNFLIVLKKIDVSNGDDDYVYQIFDLPETKNK